MRRICEEAVEEVIISFRSSMLDIPILYVQFIVISHYFINRDLFNKSSINCIFCRIKALSARRTITYK
jgi:hypothetical protein